MGRYLRIARQVLEELDSGESAQRMPEYPLMASERLLRETLSRIEELTEKQCQSVRYSVALVVARHGHALGEVFLRGDAERVAAELQVFEKSVQRCISGDL
jgi:hypothetical protein